jgi:hypothetical protein
MHTLQTFLPILVQYGISHEENYAYVSFLFPQVAYSELFQLQQQHL